MENLIDIINFGKYILIFLAGIGVITLSFGIYRKQRQLITRGAYLIILSIVLGVCGYLIYNTTVDRVQNMLNNTYIQY